MRVLGAGLLLLVACGGQDRSAGSELVAATLGATRYDQVVMKGAHNAEQRDEPLIDMLLFHRLRNVELDIHKGKGADAPAGQWWVYHADVPTQDDSSCRMLADCLGLLKAFHDAVPQHEVITVYLDMKDDFVTGHAPADLDDAITSVIGRENIVSPADVVAACPGATTLQGAVTPPCGFPTLASMRGKFVFAGTTGALCDATSHTSQYGGATPLDRLMFLAPDLSSACNLTAYAQHPDAAMFDLTVGDKALAPPTKAKGFIGRMYNGGDDPFLDGLDSQDAWNAAVSAGASQLATDEVNVAADPWATTANAHGYPFQCTGCATLTETAPVFGVTATSGDQFDTADSAFYAYENDAAASTWSAMIGVPSSHTEEYAKACLVARASEDPSAANVAFCRPFDGHPPSLQIRAAAGASTSAQDAPTFDGLSAETAVFMRLTFAANTVTASVSKDGQTWNDFGATTFAMALPLRGVSVSSHGSGPQRALFAAVTRTVAGAAPSVVAAAQLTGKAIGANASGAAFDGVFPAP